MRLGSREAAGSEFDSKFPQAFRRQSPSTVHGIGETQRKNKSRKIPEISRKFGKLPENPGHARECTSKIPETPGQSRENKKVKMQLINREIPENPGKSWKRVYEKIPENLCKSRETIIHNKCNNVGRPAPAPGLRPAGSRRLENPGNPRKRVYKKIPENPENLEK